jgi:acetylornithine deacetylase/succinyl-diaminopimelate desuccinylase-like protein
MAVEHKSLIDNLVDEKWSKDVMPTLCDFIRIPNQSPYFDSDWDNNGYMEQAIKLLMDWALGRKIKGFSLKIIKERNEVSGLMRTPIIFGVIEASVGYEEIGTTMAYAHADKQPPMDNWADGLDPYIPIIKDGKLYGRGGADDGYGMFSALVAIETLQECNLPHGRIVLLVEASEESGSPDLPFYLNLMKEEIGEPKLIICLDSGCGDYERFWLTTSLRGAFVGTLSVKVLNQGVHSGQGSGIVPSSFRIIRQLLDRIEDAETGLVHKDFFVDIPSYRMEQTKQCVKLLGASIKDEYEWAGDTSPVSSENIELLLNQTWRPQLSYIGMDGMPSSSNAGNVMRTHTELTISMRVPPSLNADDAAAHFKKIVEADSPYDATVEFKLAKAGSGFDAPQMETWLSTAVEEASNEFFGNPSACMGGGGSIPFMKLLQDIYPSTQFCITGLLGPESNAHSVNEFMSISQALGVTKSIALILTKMTASK